MKLRLITLTMNPDTGGFPSEPLADIEGEVMSVRSTSSCMGECRSSC